MLFTSVAASAAVTLGQLESFSDLHDWTSGSPNPNPPAIQIDSGPRGNGDSALRVASNGGTGAGGRLLVYNASAWTGDYLGQGIVTIAASFRNGGATALAMRLAFNGPGGWFVTPSTSLTAFSGWNELFYDIRPASLLSAGGNNATATMSAVSEMRVLHNTSVDFRGSRISSSFMIDNIQALPEPRSAMLALLGVGLFWKRKRHLDSF